MEKKGGGGQLLRSVKNSGIMFGFEDLWWWQKSLVNFKGAILEVLRLEWGEGGNEVFWGCLGCFGGVLRCFEGF